MDKTTRGSLHLLGSEPTLKMMHQKGEGLSVPPAFPTGGDVVRRVTLPEYKQAALALAEAFAEDDVCRYFTHTPDRQHWSEAQKWKLHVEIMEYITYAHILKGLVLTIGQGYGCVALW